jgi:hypothetical protein
MRKSTISMANFNIKLIVYQEHLPSMAPHRHAPLKAAQLIPGGQLAIRTLGNSRGIPGGCHGQFTTKKIPNLTYRKTNHIRAEFKTPVHW